MKGDVTEDAAKMLEAPPPTGSQMSSDLKLIFKCLMTLHHHLRSEGLLRILVKVQQDSNLSDESVRFNIPDLTGNRHLHP